MEDAHLCYLSCGTFLKCLLPRGGGSYSCAVPGLGGLGVEWTNWTIGVLALFCSWAASGGEPSAALSGRARAWGPRALPAHCRRPRRAGFFGTVVEYGAERKISRHSVLGAAVSIGVPQGVSLKVK